MTDIDTEVAALKSRAVSAEKARMLAEVKAQQAQQEADRISAALKDNYGVETIEEARDLLAKLKQDVESKKLSLSELLDKFEEAQ